jgi:hypothetical protein
MADSKISGNNRNKRGMFSQLGIIILILVGAIILFLFIAKFMASAGAESMIDKCRLSVVAQSATDIQLTASGWKSPLSVDCSRRYINFYNTRVEVGASPESTTPMKVSYEGKKVSKFSQLDDMIVNQVIAEELRICRYEFGDGKIDVFSKDKTFFESQKVCFICAEITFEDTVSQDSFTGFMEYVKNTKIVNAQQTYYQAFTEKNVYGYPLWRQPEENIDFTFNKNTKKYYVFFEKYSSSKLDLLYGNGAWIFVLPADKINNYCDIQAS